MLLSCCLPTLAAGLPTTDDGGGEANLVLPDLTGVSVAWGLDGRALLLAGIVVCLLGLGFGTVTFLRLRQAPVHPSMLEVAELIYSTCQAYLRRQGRFLILLWAFITAVPLMLLTDGMPDLHPLFTQTNVLLSWLFLGVFGNAVCFAIWNIAFQRLGVVITNNYLYASPFVTLVVGYLLLDEQITMMSVIGAVLITVGVIVALKKPREA